MVQVATFRQEITFTHICYPVDKPLPAFEEFLQCGVNTSVWRDRNRLFVLNAVQSVTSAGCQATLHTQASSRVYPQFGTCTCSVHVPTVII